MGRVAVLIPNYNGSAFLGECLKSVIEQTFEDWCAFVGDNASKDDSATIVTSTRDDRIRLIRRPRNISWVANVNLLLAESQSDYIAILHSDDWWEPEFLSTMTDLLDHSPGSLIATCAARIVHEFTAGHIEGLHDVWPSHRGHACPSTAALKLLVHHNRILTPTVLATRTLYEKFPSYEEALPLVCDWLMWLRAASVGSIDVSPHVLANYRLHRGSQSSSADKTNLWASDLVRVAQVLTSEWSGDGVPFPGAVDQLRISVAVMLLARASHIAPRGERQNAALLARLARAVAPSRTYRAFAYLCEKTLGLEAAGELVRFHPYVTDRGKRFAQWLRRGGLD